MDLEARKYDLTRKMAPFFDVHMVAPLLDYLRDSGLYDTKKVTVEKIAATSLTNMVELVEDEYERLSGDEEMAREYASKKAQMERRKEEIFAQIDNEPEAVKRVAAFFANEETISALKSSSELTLDTLASQFHITSADLESYVSFGKFKYECGMYHDCEEMLSHYLSISPSSQGPGIGGRGGSQAYLSALWGRLACRIVQANWESSRDDLKAVRAAIESKAAAALSAVDQLRSRAWLLHWGLFVLLNQRDGMDLLVDLFQDKAYLSTLENLCPWMLRYYAVAAVLSSKRRSLTRDLLQEIQLISYLYSDPLTQFIEALYDAFDFDLAQQRLKDCHAVMKTDFFLAIFADKFMDEGRALICELYCTVHRRVDLALLASKLELSEEEAERWMVSMVRSAAASSASSSSSSSSSILALDARIDSAGKQVLMSQPQRSAHQQVADRTRDLTVRTGLLGNNIEALLAEQGAYVRSLQYTPTGTSSF